MGTYQTVIRDNFFSNPKGVVEFANTLEYFDSKNDTPQGKWPGKRTKELSNINFNFKNKVSQDILKNYYSLPIDGYDMSLYFQKITPYHEKKYHPYNCGWIHADQGLFGGVIYLNEYPEDDTGTLLYDLDNFFYDHPFVCDDTKKRHHLGDDTLDEEEYINVHSRYNSQFSKTVVVENKFNRLLTFAGDQFHSMHTIGTEERLTLVFFCNHLRINRDEMYQTVRLL